MRIRRGNFGKEAILKHVTVDGVRLHLRTDERKLWVNNTHVLYLNKSANELMSLFIGMCHENNVNVELLVVNEMLKRYRKADATVISEDLDQLLGIINAIARNEIPEHLVGMKYISPYHRKAPTRMDISLTYACNNKCPHCYLPKSVRHYSVNELSTGEWKEVIDNLWDIGIPQIVFTGGECTLRSDLLELARYAKRFAVGVITNGTNITPLFAKNLKDAEVDWVQVTLESVYSDVHDEMVGRDDAFNETVRGIRNLVGAGVPVSVNVTLTKENYRDLKSLIYFVNSLGVDIVSTNALINAGDARAIKSNDSLSMKQLATTLRSAKRLAAKEGMTFNWFLPTCYKELNPVELGFGIRSCSACSINMMLEPNGDVIPCQSWTHEKLGNIIKDDWVKIWNHRRARRLRNHVMIPPECCNCDHLDACGGACPLDRINFAKKQGRRC